MTEVRIGDKSLKLIRGDITDLDVESFVFDVTEDGALGSGFGGAIQQRGGIAIQKELESFAPIATGSAVVTQAGLLKAKLIIHANGPKFREVDEEGKLRSAVQAALRRAEENSVQRVAFPPIGTGLYQVPLDLCARVMVETISEHLANDSALQEVLIVAPDSREFEPFKAQLEEVTQNA